MRKRSYFLSRRSDGWPAPSELERYFLTSDGRRQFFDSGSDGGNLVVEGLYGTGGLQPRTGRVDAYLYFVGHPEHGVILQYTKWDGRLKRNDSYNSKGDLKRLNAFVRSFEGTPLSLGLFIPFEQGWKAIKEFIETGGELPEPIDWIETKDLPPGTFPEP